MNFRGLLIAYVIVNAVLYSLLLPLWEGFDEPFHFAYVQQLANGQGFPDARTARLSNEVEASLLLAPASQVVKQNIPQVTTYSEYFSWPTSRRAEIQRRLREIPAGARWQRSPSPNYEAHHPPLAYLLLAIPEWLLARMKLPARVAILRIIAALAGSFLLLAGAGRLFSQLAIPDPYSAVALFCLFSCQMIWATIAHVANDWLALPLAAWMLVAVIRYEASPGIGSAALAALLLAVGLLTKAYFLAFAPLLIGVCIARRRWREIAAVSALLCGVAGPWYVRNLALYGVLSGMQEARGGVDLRAILHSAPTLNWPKTIWSTIHFSLWSGNNTFSTFSAGTLELLIALGMLALLLWIASRHARAEWMVFSYCALFSIALGYAAIASYVFTRGASTGPSPWYAQVLAAPLLGLMLLGASRWRIAGRFLAALLAALFGYILAATYIVKLVPLYGGYAGRTSLYDVAMLYAHGLRTLMANLNTVALAPASAVCILAAVAAALAAIQSTLLIRMIYSAFNKSKIDR